MKKTVLIILFVFPTVLTFAQQVNLSAIDALVNDTLAIHEYFQMLNEDSKNHRIKTISVFESRKEDSKSIRKTFIKYDSTGRQLTKVEHRYRKKKDSSIIQFLYDKHGNITEGLRDVSFIEDYYDAFFKYDSLNQVLECKNGKTIFKFGYLANDKKDWLSIFNESPYNAPDASAQKFYYNYNENGLMVSITNTTKDTLVKFLRNEHGKVVYKNSFDIWSDQFKYENDRLIESFSFRHNYESQDSTIMEVCSYEYDNDGLLKQMNYSETFTRDKSSFQYLYEYNSRGLICQRKTLNNKGKVVKVLKYEYEFYMD